MKLNEESCTTGTKTTPELNTEERLALLKLLDHPWKVNPLGRLEGDFKFRNFVDAMSFANQITEIAEAENHHPDLHIRFGQCRVEIWTHTINGLSRSDMILAAKIETRYETRM